MSTGRVAAVAAWVGCDDERSARAHLSRVVEPGDAALSRWLEREGWQSTLAALRSGRAPDAWLARQATLTTSTGSLLAATATRRIRCVVPGDEEWPLGLDDLDTVGAVTPACLWVRGRLPTAGSVAVVGSRACTPYGQHVAADLACGLVERGWCVVSGAAYGIDAAAHGGAVGGPGGGGDDAGAGSPTGEEQACPSVAVLACGVDTVHPVGNTRLVDRILEAGGAAVSELPPGARPTKWRFLSRNRLIAAMSVGTVVVEAAGRSGALRTLRDAEALGRYVAAVPGPVTSMASAGPHSMIREGRAVCITTVDELLELVGPMGAWGDTGPAPFVQDAVDEVGSRVLDCLSTRALGSGADLEALVAATGADPQTVSRALARLALEGEVRSTTQGWRRGEQARTG